MSPELQGLRRMHKLCQYMFILDFLVTAYIGEVHFTGNFMNPRHSTDTVMEL